MNTTHPASELPEFWGYAAMAGRRHAVLGLCLREDMFIDQRMQKVYETEYQIEADRIARNGYDAI